LNMEGMVRKWGGGEVLKRAVRGMLPKNRLREGRLARLKVFEGPAHPYNDNLMKVGGKTRIADIPEVKEELARASSSVS